MILVQIILRKIIPREDDLYKVISNYKYIPAGNYIFIVNFEHISHLVLVFLLLTLSR